MNSFFLTLQMEKQTNVLIAFYTLLYGGSSVYLVGIETSPATTVQLRTIPFLQEFAIYFMEELKLSLSLCLTTFVNYKYLKF
ncbi:hypothetical protein EGR_00608 [Echinococcus granulosus]|uniref:Uncharacterized protein n=1 Tax=Echinococcus granulosus TaxID=6210 RepID=W6UTP5_ECHGR|nr:hypothetical protein EGR_00608 [Echinococcus granulosus]EUB64658.1 hypothetical protein EGR_00608 [Echinococcus granulosus]